MVNWLLTMLVLCTGFLCDICKTITMLAFEHIKTYQKRLSSAQGSGFLNSRMSKQRRLPCSPQLDLSLCSRKSISTSPQDYVAAMHVQFIPLNMRWNQVTQVAISCTHLDRTLQQTHCSLFFLVNLWEEIMPWSVVFHQAWKANKFRQIADTSNTFGLITSCSNHNSCFLYSYIQ